MRIRRVGVITERKSNRGRETLGLGRCGNERERSMMEKEWWSGGTWNRISAMIEVVLAARQLCFNI